MKGTSYKKHRFGVCTHAVLFNRLFDPFLLVVGRNTSGG
jgi:hypothetical protein